MDGVPRAEVDHAATMLRHHAFDRIRFKRLPIAHQPDHAFGVENLRGSCIVVVDFPVIRQAVLVDLIARYAELFGEALRDRAFPRAHRADQDNGRLERGVRFVVRSVRSVHLKSLSAIPATPLRAWLAPIILSRPHKSPEPQGRCYPGRKQARGYSLLAAVGFRPTTDRL